MSNRQSLILDLAQLANEVNKSNENDIYNDCLNRLEDIYNNHDNSIDFQVFGDLISMINDSSKDLQECLNEMIIYLINE